MRRPIQEISCFTPHNKKASVLVMFLFILSAIVLFTSALSRAAYVKAKLAKNVRQAFEERLLAESCVEAAVYGLEAGPVEGYEITDEQGRLNINTQPKEVLTRFIEGCAGAAPDTASAIAAAIIDWRDTDAEPEVNGAEGSYYEGLALPYKCKDADFQSTAELLLVKAVSGEIYNKIKDSVTVFGDGKVNVNTAHKDVLVAIGFTEAQAEGIGLYAEAHGFKELSSLYEDIKKAASFNDEQSEWLQSAVSGLTTASLYLHVLSGRVEAVVGVRTESSKDAGIKYWHEI
jgi:DNA uptake protein ComE-like DNA-binding protein